LVDADAEVAVELLREGRHDIILKALRQPVRKDFDRLGVGNRVARLDPGQLQDDPAVRDLRDRDLVLAQAEKLGG
jgi:hypothetical protein